MTEYHHLNCLAPWRNRGTWSINIKKTLISTFPCCFVACTLRACSAPSLSRTLSILIKKCYGPNECKPITFWNVHDEIFVKTQSKRIMCHNIEMFAHEMLRFCGRSIRTNTHIQRSVLDNCVGDRNYNKVPMIQIHLSKPLDQACSNACCALLPYVDFETVILLVVTTARRKYMTELDINQKVHNSIHVRSPVRQGCSLSHLFFIMYGSVCAVAIQRWAVFYGCVEKREFDPGFRLEAVELKVLADDGYIAVFGADLKSVSNNGCKINQRVSRSFGRHG